MPAETMKTAETAAGLGVGQVQRMLVLRTFPAYAKLPAEHLAVVATYTRDTFLRTDTLLQREGEPSTTLYFIVTGAVELRKGSRVLKRLGPKSVVGGIGALARTPHAYDVVVAEDTLALAMKVEDTWDIFEDHFPLLRAVLQGVSRQVLENRKAMGPTAGFPEPSTENVRCPTRPLDLVERMARLRKSISFAESRLDAIAELARESRERRYTPGEILWREGAHMDSFVMLVSGIIECASEETGQRFRFGPGDAVGALDSLAGMPRWYTATAATPVTLLRIECETMFDLFEDHFELAQDVLAMMARAIMRFYEAGSVAPPPPAVSDGGDAGGGAS
jgi:CRP-like cAMP-binding protein